MIWEELRDDLIFYDLQAVDYKEVLQSMGDAMIQAGYGEEGFTEAVLEREKDYPTGLDIDGIGVAIPPCGCRSRQKRGHCDLDFEGSGGVWSNGRAKEYDLR